ncbi:MAG: hypothetical protein HQL69_10525 [Magnetococcales bacterium]|nr:hypothetical protein [Magnetococcales bacterium]
MINRNGHEGSMKIAKSGILPDSMVEIKSIVGLQGVMTLLNKCGGTRLFIPRKLNDQHKLTTLLGYEAAQKMSAYYGGETLTIVKGSRADKSLRNCEIIHRYDQGEKVPILARDYELTERHIYTILSKSC